MKFLSSVRHPLVSHLIRLREKRRYRAEQQTVVIEGVKLVGEVCRDITAKRVVVARESLYDSTIRAEEVVVVTEAMMKMISGVESPEGILAEVPMPDRDPKRLLGMSRIVVLDGVGDPGNVGTLLRTALALGWQGAFFTEGSCDPFNDKAVRGAKGATFRLPIAIGPWQQLDELLKEGGFCGVVADIVGGRPEAIAGKEKIALILGNESTGVSAEASGRFEKVSIPMPGPMESLNVAVAGGIIMYILHAGGHDGERSCYNKIPS